MYEHLRNDFLCEASKSGLSPEALEQALQALDMVADQYEVRRRETALAVYGEEIPEIVKVYLVCKKMAGLSEKTLETYMRMLRIFFQAVRKPVEFITPNDIRVYLFAYQRERGCSNRSLDKYRGYLSSFFAWAADEGYLTRNPMKTIPVIKYEKKPRQNLTQLELEYLRDGCKSARDRAIVEVFYSTGCRVSELAGLKKADVDWDTRAVHLFGKGRKHRTSYLNAKAEVALRSYLATREDDCEYLFVSERKPHRNISEAAIEKVIRKINGRSAFNISKPVTPHVLRHTTATIALQSGMPIEEISKLLGHENISTTMIYAHASLESVRSGHQKHIV